MVPRLLLIVTFLALFGGGPQTAQARGRLRLPPVIIYGYGDELTDLGELPTELSEGLQSALGTKVRLGFVHQSCHLFWLNVWTWNGHYVLQDGDRYWEIEPSYWEHWKQEFGLDPARDFGPPLMYRFPLLPVLVVLGAVSYWARKKYFPSREERRAACSADPRYQRALSTVLGPPPDRPHDPPATRLDESRLQIAVSELIRDGAPAGRAEANLRDLAVWHLASVNAQIDAVREAAARLANEGEFDRSAEIYEQIVANLPADDGRLQEAQQLLRVVSEQSARRGPSSSETTDDPRPTTGVAHLLDGSRSPV